MVMAVVMNRRPLKYLKCQDFLVQNQQFSFYSITIYRSCHLFLPHSKHLQLLYYCIHELVNPSLRHVIMAKKVYHGDRMRIYTL